MRLIDADELVKRFKIIANDNWNKQTPTSWGAAFSDAIEIVDEQPTIDPVRHGGWGHDFYDDGEGGENWFRFCSECEVEVSEENAKLWRYCPFCGAQMDGGE